MKPRSFRTEEEIMNSADPCANCDGPEGRHAHGFAARVSYCSGHGPTVWIGWDRGPKWMDTPAPCPVNCQQFIRLTWRRRLLRLLGKVQL